MSATRGSQSTEYAGHDISEFFPRADNHFLAGFRSVTFPFDCIFLWSLSPSCQMSRRFHQTCFDAETLCILIDKKEEGWLSQRDDWPNQHG